MIVANRGGHSINCRGAKFLIDEVEEAHKINSYLIKWLEIGGAESIDCTSRMSNVKDDLYYGTDKANNFNANFFISIHFNNAYNKEIESNLGCECFICKKGYEAEKVANRILTKVCQVANFKNRGVKVDKESLGYSLHDLNKTIMPSVLIEICFVESKEDVKKYLEVGAEQIAKAIAEGILNKNIEEVKEEQKETKLFYRVICGSYENKKNALEVKKDLEMFNFKGVWIEEKEIEKEK